MRSRREVGRPVLALPTWAESAAQPIAGDDLVSYLVGALEIPLAESVVYEVGGSEVVTYRELIQAYAAVRGLQTPIVELPAPVLPLARLGSLPIDPRREVGPPRVAVGGRCA